MLPLIADYFQASADYLFYGEKIIYQDIYAKNGKRVAQYPQISREAYEESTENFCFGASWDFKWQSQGRRTDV